MRKIPPVIDVEGMPVLNLNHIELLTDDTGIIQHARYALPHYPEGYCTDDNARALAFAVSSDAVYPSKLGSINKELIGTYAAFMNAAFNPETRQFRNFMSYDRQWLDDGGSDDCQGRSLYALGATILNTSDSDLRQWAAVMFQTAVTSILTTSSPRAWAQALLGIDAYLSALAGDRNVQRVGDQLEERLISLFRNVQSEGWHWFENELTYDNAILPQALIARGAKNPETLEIGVNTLKWLVAQQSARAGHFRPIGSSGFYPRDGERAMFDQQPIEAAGKVSACLAAYKATEDNYWLMQARIAFAWFHGRNDIGTSIYDPQSGGCRDGLCLDRVNMNQGAESTLAYLSARLQMDVVEKRQVPIIQKTNGLARTALPTIAKNGSLPNSGVVFSGSEIAT
ncbi:MAG: hypothetical protein ABJA67_09515 [Chthonomonadales bacterium]